MDPELRERLSRCRSLPTPPLVACKVLDLCEQPDFDITELCETLKHDPALCARILRASNSPVYGYRRRAKTLKDALLFLGSNAVVSLALSFTLSVPLENASRISASYTRFWQRSAMTALVATEAAKRLGIEDLETMFLMGLLQGIGQFVLLKTFPQQYIEMLNTKTEHAAIRVQELDAFGTSHVEVGAWLLEEWRLPELITESVARSHAAIAEIEDLSSEAQCLAFAWRVAEYMLDADGGDPKQRSELKTWTRTLFDGHVYVLSDLFDAARAQMKEFKKLFEAGPLQNIETREAILERAQELQFVNSVKMAQGARFLEDRYEALQNKADRLAQQTNVDPLTGLFGRHDLDEELELRFERARAQGARMSLLMIDLDNLKQQNDRFGHLAGDEALRRVGRSISTQIRENDFAARYGGDEFVVLIDGADSEKTQRIAERIRESLADEPIETLESELMPITASIGTAIFDGGAEYSNVRELLHAADKELYEAKHAGRNKVSMPDQGIALTEQQRVPNPGTG